MIPVTVTEPLRVRRKSSMPLIQARSTGTPKTKHPPNRDRSDAESGPCRRAQWRRRDRAEPHHSGQLLSGRSHARAGPR